MTGSQELTPFRALTTSAAVFRSDADTRDAAVAAEAAAVEAAIDAAAVVVETIAAVVGVAMTATTVEVTFSTMKSDK